MLNRNFQNYSGISTLNFTFCILTIEFRMTIESNFANTRKSEQHNNKHLYTCTTSVLIHESSLINFLLLSLYETLIKIVRLEIVD